MRYRLLSGWSYSEIIPRARTVESQEEGDGIDIEFQDFGPEQKKRPSHDGYGDVGKASAEDANNNDDNNDSNHLHPHPHHHQHHDDREKEEQKS